MTKLLRKYNNTKKKFRTEKVIKQYPDTFAWSKAFNIELIKILSEMNVEELSYLLKNTQGMFRDVIQKYLDEARKKEAQVDELVLTTA